jgi:molybdenum cofactor cytidylyltransferase
MISAIILAAGQSKRMGKPKMLLPWDKSTVLQTVITTFQAAGVDDILVVTGGARTQVEELIGQTAQTVYNENFEYGEMLSSIQMGLKYKLSESSAALIALGDQPQVQVKVIRRVLQEYKQTNSSIIVPSYQMRRGHPWLVARDLWEEILNIPFDGTEREFLNNHAKEIHYLKIDSPSILQDLDTPQDYLEAQTARSFQKLK